jgi:hypothetical protein
MEVIEIKTLVDITNTNVRRINQGTQLELDQYRNWTTLQHCIGMRSIIDYDKNPQIETINVKGMGFGTEFTGSHQVWTFRFRTDRPEAFAKDNNSVALLEEDLDMVPVILNLTETINTQRAVFDLFDKKFKNTLVKAI